MRIKIIPLAIIFIAATFVSCNKEDASKKVTLANQMDSVSYGLGLDIARSMKKQDVTQINVDLMKAGYVHAMTDTAGILMNEEITGKVLQSYFQGVQEAAMAKQKEADKVKFAGNVEAGKKFLAENATKEGVKTTASGLQYKVVKEGKGAIPTATDKVKTHYKGTLIDGTVFDSSYERGEPISFPVNGVIPGWTEALQLMKVGSKWELYIPQELAYGDRDMGQIQPYSTLVFEVELIEIEKQ